MLDIYRSATGRVVATAQLPKPDHVFAAVARLGSGHTYVAAAITSFRGCRTQLYRFSIDSRGQPSGLTPILGQRTAEAVCQFTLRCCPL